MYALSPRPSSEQSSIALHLLNGFRLFLWRQPIALSIGTQRVVALLAVRLRPLRRSYVAGMLWPDCQEQRAMASLRSELWRLRQRGCALVEANTTEVWLQPAVWVDLQAAVETARGLLEGEPPRDDARDAWHAFGLLAFDLLPDWSDDWVAIERESFRQLRLSALEAMCESLTAAGLLRVAVQVGLAAVEAEPLRESAHRVLMRAFAAAGNRGDVIRQFRRYQQTLHDEVGIAPSLEIEELVRDLAE